MVDRVREDVVEEVPCSQEELSKRTSWNKTRHGYPKRK
jgi:hypothetical protein